jgi:hypothetical protein
VAANVDALEGDLTGLTIEAAADVNTPPPADPVIPPDGYGRGPQAPPPTQWDAIVAQQFRLYAGRTPTVAEATFARGFEPDVAALRAWIQAGAPLSPSTPPPSTPPPAPPPSGALERNPGERAHVERRLQEAAAARGRPFDPAWVDQVMAVAIARPDWSVSIDADINDFITAALGG